MKLARSIAAAAAAALTIAAFPLGGASAGKTSRLDLDDDGRVDGFDLALARMDGDLEKTEKLRSFVLGDYSPEPDPGAKEGYSLVWSDEFDGDSVDETKWSFDRGNWKYDNAGNFVTTGWGNNEQQYYDKKNASVKDGVLTIAARREAVSDEVQGRYDYTSAKLHTKGKFSFCGGRVEVRARCDSGKSLWPAIWALPEDEIYGGWAASGEIDIMEGWGSKPGKICGTIHFGDVWPNNRYLTADYEFPSGGIGDWRTYAVEWDKGELRWYVDDVLYSTQTDWSTEGRSFPAPFDQNFYLILNLAVGGHFDGVDGIYADPATFADGEKRFEVDYVRVYKKDGSDFRPTEQTSEALEAYIEGAEAKLRNIDGGTVVDVTSVGALEYGVMGLIRGREVAPGETYTLSFTASSTIEREIVVTAEDSAYNRYLNEKITIGPEAKSFSFPVEFPEAMTADIKFQLGAVGEASSAPHEIALNSIAFSR